MKITERVTDFVQLSADQKHLFFQQLWSFDQQIFPNSQIESLYQFVYDLEAVSVQVVQYFHQNILVGQNIISIIKLHLNRQPIFVVMSRAGFLPQYRRRNMSLRSAIRIAFQHRIRHPSIPLWFVTTLMQPKVYSLFASRTVSFFPRQGKKMSHDHLKVLEMIMSRKPLVEKRDTEVFTHYCDVPKVTPEQLIRLRHKYDSHHQFFLQHVPDYFDGMGMMCICQLDLKTIAETTFNLALGRRVS